MKISIKNITGKDQGELEVKFALIENGKGTQAVHDTVAAYRAAQRSGTACTKNAGEVAGTNKKPWRQKGTGRARAGSFQSPLWVRRRRGLRTQAPRFHARRFPRKPRALALRKALERAAQGRRRGDRGRFEADHGQDEGFRLGHRRAGIEGHHARSCPRRWTRT